MEPNPKPVPALPLAEAARWLHLDQAAVQALIRAGYLGLASQNHEPGMVPLVEIKAFQARNAEGGIGGLLGLEAEPADTRALLEALSARTKDLATRVYETFAGVVPEARHWSFTQQQTFTEQAKSRLEAILAVAGHGAEVDESLRRDLEEVGANAAWASSSLPHLLVVLRISRDLLLQTAVRMAETREGRWNAVLATFIARLPPSIDRLTDALSMGYWGARLERMSEELDRLAAVVHHLPHGIYEADLDGVVRFANPALAVLIGRPGADLVGWSLGEVFNSAPNVGALVAEPPGDVGQVSVSVDTAVETAVGTAERGSPLVPFDIDTVVRRSDGKVVGFAGVVQRARLGQQRAQVSANDGLVHHIQELKRSIDVLIDAGAFISRHATQMRPEQVEQAGQSIKRQSQRLQLIVDELDAERKA